MADGEHEKGSVSKALPAYCNEPEIPITQQGSRLLAQGGP
jgi:hypothetical protein